MEYFNTVPDYNSYLVYILTKMVDQDEYIRSVAGLTLKNNIKTHYATIPPPVLDYVKTNCLQHIGDPVVSKTVGLVVAAIMSRGQVQNWPQGLQALMEKLDDPSSLVVQVIEGWVERAHVCMQTGSLFRENGFPIRMLTYLLLAPSSMLWALCKESVKTAPVIWTPPSTAFTLWTL